MAGFPVTHSLSPAIHRAAYTALDLDWTYEHAEVAPDRFPDFVLGLDPSRWRGLSVTAPLKEETALLGHPDDDVRLTGVANTLVWSRGERYAFNTDIAGFRTALASKGLDDVRSATVIGSGATAVSALAALGRMGVQDVWLLARNSQRVGELGEWASAFGLDVRPLPWGGGVATDSDLVMCTLAATVADSLVDDLALPRAPHLRGVFDVSYHPWPTRLALLSEGLGVAVVNGLDLLAHQAVEQVRLMTSREVSAHLLLAEAQLEIERRAHA